MSVTPSLWENRPVRSDPNICFSETNTPREHLRRAAIRASTNARQMELPIVLPTLDTGESMPAKALLDSGCSQTSIDYSFVQQHRLTTTPAAVVVPVHNAV